MTATIATTLRADNLGMVIRSFSGLVIGFFVTAALFWLMQNLIESADGTLGNKSTGPLITFVRVERDETVLPKPDEIVKPPEPEKQPPKPDVPSMDDPTIIGVTETPSSVPLDLGPLFEGSFNPEGNYLPIVKVAPIYPSRALQRGVEGVCVVQYTITQFGTIKDPMVIEDQCSSSLFYDSSINAALKFKYKPRVVGGVQVEVSGVQNKFTYKIEG